jgi:hypothetical protein
MTEPRAMEQFEARFAELVRAYTDAAMERRIDARAVARASMSSRGASSWVAGTPSWRIAGAPWAAALAAVVVVGVVAIAVLQRPSDPATVPNTTATTPAIPRPIPAEILHAWQRPYAVTPGDDQWGTGYLNVSNGILEFRRSLSDSASRSTFVVTGPDVIVATATAETADCTIGDIGAYGWVMEGKGTVMTLTAIGLDRCTAREESLVGMWVRADLPAGPGGGGLTLPPGTHLTSAFDPFGDLAATGQLSYTVPEGWKVKEDTPATFVLHRVPDPQSASPTDSIVFLFAEPRVAAEFDEGAACGNDPGDAAGIGTGADDIIAAMRARPSVVSTPPTAVTVGGYSGHLLDLQLAPSWTGGCLAPEGPLVGSLIIRNAGAGPGPIVALTPDVPVRLVLLDLGNDRTMAIAVSCFGSSRPDVLEAAIADAMPVIESFKFHPPAP